MKGLLITIKLIMSKLIKGKDLNIGAANLSIRVDINQEVDLSINQNIKRSIARTKKSTHTKNQDLDQDHDHLYICISYGGLKLRTVI
jgi:hypothetical protein